MQRIEKTVFISYRRADAPWALAIFQYLTHDGYDVFFDFSGIASGDFEHVIIENIKARAHFLVLLTPSALKRCSDPDDWLRREVETALASQRNVVPLMLADFDFSAPGISEQLKGELAELKKYNALRVPPEYFEEAMERLCDKYLNIPLNSVLHPASITARQIAESEQRAAKAAPEANPTRLTPAKAAPEAMKKPAEEAERKVAAEATELRQAERAGAEPRATTENESARLKAAEEAEIGLEAAKSELPVASPDVQLKMRAADRFTTRDYSGEPRHSPMPTRTWPKDSLLLGRVPKVVTTALFVVGLLVCVAVYFKFSTGRKLTSSNNNQLSSVDRPVGGNDMQQQTATPDHATTANLKNSNPHTLIAVGANGTIIRTAYSASLSACVVGEGGTILCTQNGGVTWQARDSKADDDLWFIVFATPKSGWGVGANGTIVHTDDSGATWEGQASGTTEWLFGVTFLSPRQGWAVGKSGIILHTEDGGNTWKTQNSGTTAGLFAVTFSTARLGWAVGERSTILHTEDGGATWKAQRPPVRAYLYGVAFPNTQQGWAVGERGTILHTADGGASWTRQGSGTTEWLHSIALANEHYGWAVGKGGLILQTGDGGTTWRANDVPFVTDLHSLAQTGQ